jgi:hypothetical protein
VPHDVVKHATRVDGFENKLAGGGRYVRYLTVILESAQNAALTERRRLPHGKQDSRKFQE